MYKKLVNLLSRYFTVKGYGAVRMNNAIQQFRSVIEELGQAAQEIADQRPALDAERHRLLDQADAIESKMLTASADMSRAIVIRDRMVKLIGD